MLTDQTALLLLDFQVDFLAPAGRYPVAGHQVEPMLTAANRLIAAAQPAGTRAETQQSGNPKKQTCRLPIGMLARSAARIMAVRRAVVQTFATDTTKRSGTLRGPCGENCIPNFGRSFAIDAELSEFELTFPDSVHQFNAGDGN